MLFQKSFVKELGKSEWLHKGYNIEFSVHALDTIHMHFVFLDVLPYKWLFSAATA
jgi:hypothetical protein